MTIRAWITLITLAATTSLGACARYYDGRGPIDRFIAVRMTPEDMYDPSLIEAQIDIGRAGPAGSWEFEHRYRGKHVAGLLFEKAWGDANFENALASFRLTVELNFYSGAELVRSVYVAPGDLEDFTLPEKNGRGVSLYVYNSPPGLPFGNVLRCELTILEPDPAISSALGSVTFFLRKGEDFERVLPF